MTGGVHFTSGHANHALRQCTQRIQNDAGEVLIATRAGGEEGFVARLGDSESVERGGKVKIVERSFAEVEPVTLWIVVSARVNIGTRGARVYF